MILSHSWTININLLSKHESNVWQNPNDPDDENEHFKQPLIAIEQFLFLRCFDFVYFCWIHKFQNRKHHYQYYYKFPIQLFFLES